MADQPQPHPDQYTPEELDRARQLLTAALADRGEQVIDEVIEPGYGPCLKLANGNLIGLNAFLDQLPDNEHSHRPSANHWIAQFIDEDYKTTPFKDLPEEVIRRDLRSRLMPPIPENVGDFSYGRDFAPQVVQLLALDTATEVITLSADEMAGTPFSMEDLFLIAAHNTDQRVPIDRITALAGGIYAVEGNSFFIASKAMNIRYLLENQVAELAASQGIELPSFEHGVLFGIPHRHALFFTPVEAETFQDQAGNILPLLDDLRWTDAAKQLPGGPISGITFYWDPWTNSIEIFGGRNFKEDGTSQLVAFAGEHLTEHLKEMGIYDQVVNDPNAENGRA